MCQKPDQLLRHHCWSKSSFETWTTKIVQRERLTATLKAMSTASGLSRWKWAMVLRRETVLKITFAGNDGFCILYFTFLCFWQERSVSFTCLLSMYVFTSEKLSWADRLAFFFQPSPPSFSSVASTCPSHFKIDSVWKMQNAAIYSKSCNWMTRNQASFSIYKYPKANQKHEKKILAKIL